MGSSLRYLVHAKLLDELLKLLMSFACLVVLDYFEAWKPCLNPSLVPNAALGTSLWTLVHAELVDGLRSSMI
jgi:hypothetical protein